MWGRGRFVAVALKVLVVLTAGCAFWRLHSFPTQPSPDHSDLSLNEVQAIPEHTATTTACPSKRILVWNSFWMKGATVWEHIFLRQISRLCPESRCELVYNHELLDKADAVLFHPIDIRNLDSMPQRHPPRQLWVFFSLEPPPILVEHQRALLKRLGGVFNWTMTYRRDSDVVVPYGLVLQRPAVHGLPKDYWVGKSAKKMAVWTVSHCKTASRRELYVEQLAKYIPVDIFGKCGKKKCGSRLTVTSAENVNKIDCDNELQRYMFYLAFENSICLDYITEKFYKALQLEVVPVVLGGGSYKDVAPPDSFIDALSFPSPKLLASYLKRLAADRIAYNRFFAWKQSFSVELGHPFPALVCDLCAKLHDPSSFNLLNTTRSPPRQTRVVDTVQGRDGTGSYPDIEEWFVRGGECRRWQQEAKQHAKEDDKQNVKEDPKQDAKQNAKRDPKQDAQQDTKQNAMQEPKQDAKQEWKAAS